MSRRAQRFSDGGHSADDDPAQLNPFRSNPSSPSDVEDSMVMSLVDLPSNPGLSSSVHTIIEENAPTTPHDGNLDVLFAVQPAPDSGSDVSGLDDDHYEESDHDVEMELHRLVIRMSEVSREHDTKLDAVRLKLLESHLRLRGMVLGIYTRIEPQFESLRQRIEGAEHSAREAQDLAELAERIAHLVLPDLPVP